MTKHRKLGLKKMTPEQFKEYNRQQSKEWREKHKNDTPEEVAARKLYWANKHIEIKKLAEEEAKLKNLSQEQR